MNVGMFFVIFSVVLSIVDYAIYRYKHPPVQVMGDSMLPTYYDRQWLKSRRVSPKEDLELHKVYVFKSPTDKNRLNIKRLHKITKYGLFFVGDNLQCSFDSRSYGYVSRADVIAEIIET